MNFFPVILVAAGVGILQIAAVGMVYGELAMARPCRCPTNRNHRDYFKCTGQRALEVLKNQFCTFVDQQKNKPGNAG